MLGRGRAGWSAGRCMLQRQLPGGCIAQPMVSNLRIPGTFALNQVGITCNSIQMRHMSSSNEQDRHGLDIMGNFRKEWQSVYALDGVLPKFKHLFRRFGLWFPLIYFGPFWLGPMAASYAFLDANGNFGLQPEQLVGALPEALQPALQGILSSMPQNEDGSMAPWCTSLAGAYVFTEVFEIVRLPATVLLLPSIPHLIGAPAADPSSSGSSETSSGSSSRYEDRNINDPATGTARQDSEDASGRR